ncbi:TetR/AcrR family transcriptional regulator [soil metagenome]
MDTHQPPVRARARRLAPDERRAALLAAATELFVAHGSAFTTADLAAAAGVSEGTIFRYFPDKASLIAAARDSALGLESLIPELAVAAEHGTLEERLVAAGDVLSAKIAQMARVMEDVEPHEHSHEPPDPDLMAEVQAALLPLFGDVAAGAPGNRAQLANVFMGMLFSNTLLSLKTDTEPMAVTQLVRLFVHGMSAP